MYNSDIVDTLINTNNNIIEVFIMTLNATQKIKQELLALNQSSMVTPDNNIAALKTPTPVIKEVASKAIKMPPPSRPSTFVGRTVKVITDPFVYVLKLFCTCLGLIIEPFAFVCEGIEGFIAEMCEEETYDPNTYHSSVEIQGDKHADLKGGYTNGGNTCYTATMLQCLNSIPYFQNFLSDDTPLTRMEEKIGGKIVLEADTKYKLRMQIRDQLKKLMTQSNAHNTVSSDELITLLQLFNTYYPGEPRFNIGHQEDLQEVVQAVIDVLQIPNLSYRYVYRYNYTKTNVIAYLNAIIPGLLENSLSEASIPARAQNETEAQYNSKVAIIRSLNTLVTKTRAAVASKNALEIALNEKSTIVATKKSKKPPTQEALDNAETVVKEARAASLRDEKIVTDSQAEIDQFIANVDAYLLGAGKEIRYNDNGRIQHYAFTLAIADILGIDQKQIYPLEQYNQNTNWPVFGVNIPVSEKSLDLDKIFLERGDQRTNFARSLNPEDKMSVIPPLPENTAVNMLTMLEVPLENHKPRIANIPPILMFALGRYSDDVVVQEKNHHPVNLNDTLSLPVVGTNYKLIYKLCSVGVHYGNSRRGGHYVAYVKQKFDDKEGWAYYSDSNSVKKVGNISQAKKDMSENGYMSFYEYQGMAVT